MPSSYVHDIGVLAEKGQESFVQVHENFESVIVWPCGKPGCGFRNYGVAVRVVINHAGEIMWAKRLNRDFDAIRYVEISRHCQCLRWLLFKHSGLVGNCKASTKVEQLFYQCRPWFTLVIDKGSN